MGEGKSEGGPGVDRGGGRGCQPGPGLSSGSLFLPRVSLGAAGDNVALSGVAGGGGTRRTERYPPGHVPAGAGGIGAAGRASGERVPLGRGGGFLLFSPLSPTPVTSLCHPKVPRRTGGAQLPGCPDASRGRWPVPITGAFGDPASLAHLGGGGGEHPPARGRLPPAPPPRHCLWQWGGHPWPCRLPPCPTASLVLLSPAGSFVPGGSSPGGTGTRAGCLHLPAPCTAPDSAGRGGLRGGTFPAFPAPPPHFRLPSMGNRNIPLPQPFPLSPAPANRGVKKGHPNHPWGASHST